MNIGGRYKPVAKKKHAVVDMPYGEVMKIFENTLCADRMAVVIEAMRTYFFQRATAVYFAVAGQIEMIADVTEAAVVDVVAAAILKAQGHALRRG